VLETSSLVAFVPVTDLDRARAFYEGTLGLPIIDASPFALVADANGTHIRITPVGELRPQPFTVLGWVVDDIAAAVDVLTAAGVAFTRYDAVPQDERGIWTTPDGGQVAWFTDPDGNTLSVTQYV